ncbi:MAG TPA: peptidoglycan DD-metalloendopeptidase family protein [Solirubrobacterales bacterium]|nr:peptidoglycan DD-metalloendopeptidase family protein [Solirubrobacterales bacterium]
MLRNRSLTAACLAAAAVLAALLLAGAAAAKDLESKLEDQQAQLSKVEARKGVLTTTISGYDDRIERLVGELAALRNREAHVRSRLAVKQAELDRAYARLNVAKDRLEVVRAHLKRALVTLRERLVAIYETGSPDVLGVILSSGDYGELVNRTEYLSRIHEMDEAVIGRVRELRNEARTLVEGLRGSKNRIEAARDVIAAQEAKLAGARRAVQSRQGQLVAARGQRLAALAKIRKHEQELDGSVAAIQAKIAARLAGYGSAPLPAGPIRYGSGGGLIWPVDGPVVSGFGGRNIGAGYEYHPGIDIAVPEGTPIRAAADGTVIFTQPEASSGGYGNYTCIDHGGGLSTCYAHQTSFAVSAGQSVSQGQVIGYTGCTGYCLGPHLHFEVRIDGEVTDPMAYL